MPPRDYFEKDYYRTLGVAKDASQSDIAKAYRGLARQLHPDANPDDPKAEARFKEVSEAHSILANAGKRKEYDQVREMAAAGAGRGFGSGTQGPFGGGAGFPGAENVDLGDLFGGLFGEGGGFGRRRAGQANNRKGRDVETDLTLSFDDAMAGVTTTLRVSGPAGCHTCHGSGARPGTMPITCTTCDGRGYVPRNQGLFSLSEPCPTCGGSGREIPDPCPTCHGSGTETRTREIRTRIPAGVRDAARIRLAGKGEPGVAGGPPGDLFVRVHVAPDELFGRRGDDLTLRVPITYAEAALGAKISVPTLDEPVTVRIPGGTESGRTFRVRGRGAPKTGGRGDLLVTVEVAVPRKVSKAQRKLLESLAETEKPVREHLERRFARAQGV